MVTRNKTPLNVDALTEDERATWQQPINREAALTVVPDNTLGPMDFEEEEIEETAVERIAAALGDLVPNSRAYVKVQRHLGSNKYGHCKDYPVDEYEAGGPEMIRADWGAGEYDIRLYGVRPATGKFGVITSGRLVIMETKGEPVAQRANSELSQVLQTIAQGQQQMLQALTERPTAPDPMTQLTQMMGLFTTMQRAMQPATPERTPVGEALAMAREMREAAQEFATGKKSSDDDEPDLMKAALPLIQMIGARMGQGEAQSAQPAQQPVTMLPSNPQPGPWNAPQVAPSAAIPPQPELTGENMDLGVIALIGNLNRLTAMAAANKPVEEGAQLIYEKIPDDFIDLMAAPEWFSLLCQVQPSVKPHEAWLTQARDAALKMFESGEQEPEVTETPAVKG